MGKKKGLEEIVPHSGSSDGGDSFDRGSFDGDSFFSGESIASRMDENVRKDEEVNNQRGSVRSKSSSNSKKSSRSKKSEKSGIDTLLSKKSDKKANTNNDSQPVVDRKESLLSSNAGSESPLQGGDDHVDQATLHLPRRNRLGNTASSRFRPEEYEEAPTGCFSSCFMNPVKVMEKRYADVVIVGAGFSGAYCAYQLKKFNPSLKVVILELTDRIGGRLMSDDNDEDNKYNKDELGGMRIFPKTQKKVADIIREVGCEMVKVGLTDDDNYVYLKNVQTRKKDFRINGKTPKELLDKCVQNFKEEQPLEAVINPFESRILSQLSLREFMKKYGASDEEIEQWFTHSGYNIFDDDAVPAAIHFAEGEMYGSSMSDDHHFIRQGYQAVVQKMVKESRVKVLHNCHVVRMSKQGGQGTGVEYIQDAQGGKMIIAKYVICGLPYEKMCQLAKNAPVLPQARKLVLKRSIKQIPLFKCFLEWERIPGRTQWWVQHGLNCGKSTTDLDIRQIFYYDNEDILIYNSGPYAKLWRDKFNDDPDKAARDAVEQLRIMHGRDIEIPDPDYSSTIYKFWPDGSHKWRKNVRVKQAMHTICDGSFDKSQVYICGDAFSTHQGWTMGCIQTADICLKGIKQHMTKPKRRIIVSKPSNTIENGIKQLEFQSVPFSIDNIQLNSNQVLVKVKACCLNFPDLLQLSNRYQHKQSFPYTPGLEIAGIVVKVPNEEKTQFKVGDKILAATGGNGMSDYIVCETAQTFKMPPNFSFEQASAFRMGFETAYHCLVERGKIQSSDTVLINGATGGMGLAAAIMAKQVYGCKVICLGGNDEKLKIVQSVSKCDHTINYNKNREFHSEIKHKLTDGKGVDLVFDTVGGETFQQCVKSTGFLGRVCIVGFTSGKWEKIASNYILIKCLSILGCRAGEVLRRTNDGNNILQMRMNKLLQLAKEGILIPFISHTYSFNKDQVQKAFSCISSRKVVGRVVVVINNNDESKI